MVCWLGKPLRHIPALSLKQSVLPHHQRLDASDAARRLWWNGCRDASRQPPLRRPRPASARRSSGLIRRGSSLRTAARRRIQTSPTTSRDAGPATAALAAGYHRRRITRPTSLLRSSSTRRKSTEQKFYSADTSRRQTE